MDHDNCLLEPESRKQNGITIRKKERVAGVQPKKSCGGDRMYTKAEVEEFLVEVEQCMCNVSVGENGEG